MTSKLLQLFNKKCDLALENYLEVRRRAAEFTTPGSDEWQSLAEQGIRLKSEYETWRKAAEFVRQSLLRNL